MTSGASVSAVAAQGLEATSYVTGNRSAGAKSEAATEAAEQDKVTLSANARKAAEAQEQDRPAAEPARSEPSVLAQRVAETYGALM